MQAPENLLPDNPAYKPKRSLVLAGGGIRMSYQAGVLQALQEAGLNFVHVDGTSGGIFNTAMMASGLSPYEMAERWRKLKVESFVSMTPVNNYLRIKKMAAWGDADGIRNKVFPQLGIDIIKIHNNKDFEATFNVCNFSNKSVEAIPHREVLIEHLLAGVSLPIFMPSLKVNDQWYSDAVWIKDANLMEAVKRGSEELWLVWAIGNTRDYLPGSFNQYVHMIEMSANGGLLEEFEQIKLINCNINSGKSPYGQKRPVKLHVIKPGFPLPLDPDLFFRKTDATTLINMGYADGKGYLEDLPSQGIAMDVSASKMNEPGITFSFRHCYEGKLKVDNQLQNVRFNPAFIFRKTGNKYRLDFYSSIFIESIGREISTYHNIITLSDMNNKRRMLLLCYFFYNGQVYSLRATVLMGSSLDWVMGLEFKNIKIEINPQEHDGNAFSFNGMLSQSAKTRLKNLFRSKADQYSHKGTAISTQLNMIKKLYSHEI